MILKENKGITLIALIITIVVLLVLAGVSINMLLGENGIVNKSQVATQEYESEQEKEELQIAKFENEIEKYVNGNRDTVTISKEEYSLLTNNFNYVENQDQIIGKWNGKNIYRRIIVTDNLNIARNTGTYYQNVTNLNIDKTISLNAILYLSAGNQVIGPNESTYFQVNDYNGGKWLYGSQNVTSGNILKIITILVYTKTAD